MAKTKAITIGNERVCTKCGKRQPLVNFREFKHRLNGKLYREGQCDACRVAYSKGYVWPGLKALRDEKQAIVVERKKAPCTDCGRHFPPVCMDFDHVRDEKKAGIAHIVASVWSVEVLLEELAKCELVCSNCHRIRTHEDKELHLRRIRKGRQKAGLACSF